MHRKRVPMTRVKHLAWIALLAVVCCLFGCNGSSSGSGASSNTSSSTTASTSASGALPLGDGMYSTTPKVGYLMSCVTQWSTTKTHSGFWIQGNVWYPSEKIAVEGAVNWPGASTTISTSGTTMTITSNDLPTPPETTGIFPIQSSDPAYQYDTNPNAIVAQSIHLTLPTNPTVAAQPTCVPMGMVGFATDGVAIFDALDNSGHDAVAHEVQDSCDGHPNGHGEYHFHGPSPCMPNEMTSGLVGYALDGFGIYGEIDYSTGKVLHDSDLDACHGTTSPVLWHGQLVNMYHYVLTAEFPYTIGCFRGTPVAADLTAAQKGEIANFP